MLVGADGPMLGGTTSHKEMAMSGSAEGFQISLQAAEAYESKFVPALFSEWAPYLIGASGITSGQRVLDVACGTGVVAREVVDRLRGTATVVGVDINEAMLAVARRLGPEVEWRQGDACALPFSDASFDAVVCQASLMFFPDRTRALQEMARVTTDEGTVAVQVWAGLESQPAYGPFVEIAARHAGPQAIDLLSSYWSLGDMEHLRSLFEASGLQVCETSTRVGTARFGSIDEVVRIEVESTPLIDRIDEEVYSAILEDSRKALAPFRTASGRVEMPIVGHLVAGSIARSTATRGTLVGHGVTPDHDARRTGSQQGAAC